MSKLHVFQITDAEWWAGESAEAAVADYLKEYGDDAKELMDEFGTPKKLSDSDLDEMTITDIDEPGQPIFTFREALNDLENSGDRSGFIATGEY